MTAVKKLKTIVTDKDPSIRNSIRKILPDISLKLCVFHVLKAFYAHLVSFKLSKGEMESVFGKFRAMCFTDSEEYFQNLQKEMNSICSSESLLKYIQDRWYSCKEEWAGYGMKKIVTYGNNTNNRIESKNQKLKNMCASHYSIDMSIIKVIEFIENDVETSNFYD